LSTRAHGFALAAGSGVLLALSFPKFGYPPLAWIALAPLLVALTQNVSLPRAFALGLTTGAIYFGGTLYWMSMVMARYGELSLALAVAINAVFVAYLALFPALFAVLTRRLSMLLGVAALPAAPFVWAATELGRTYLFSGFPWVLLGYSQTTVLPIAQAASIVGVFGVSAIVVSVNVAFAGIVAGRALRPAALVMVGVLLVAVWGSARVRDGALTRQGEPLRVGLVQGNALEEERDARGGGAEILKRHLEMTREAIAGGAALVILPESALSPYALEEFPVVTASLREAARQTGVPILLGSDQ